MNDPTVTPLPTAAVFAGVDWASADHAVYVIDAAGTVLWRHTVTHSRAGLTRLTGRLRELGVGRGGIERPDGPVVEALLAAGLRVAMVPPRQVKNLRSRYGRAGKDDRFDAYVLADALRTDGHRFTDLTRDSAPTMGLRALVRARQDLVEVRVGLVNQLRHNLELAFPGAVGLFFDLHSPIARAFLRRFPAAAEAAVLDEDSHGRLADRRGLLRAHPGRGPHRPAAHRPGRTHRRRGRRPPARHPRPAGRHRRHRGAGRRAGAPDQGGTRPAPGRADLHQPAPRRTAPGRRAAGRGRRRPRPLSRPASPGRRGRGQP